MPIIRNAVRDIRNEDEAGRFDRFDEGWSEVLRLLAST